MNRVIAIMCFVVGSIFTALFLLVFMTKLTRFFSQVRADLVMVALGLGAYGCYRAGIRFWRMPAADADHPA